MRRMIFVVLLALLCCIGVSGCSPSESADDSVGHISAEPSESAEPETEEAKPVTKPDPIVTSSDLMGIWVGDIDTASENHRDYLYFSSSGVYWMAYKTTLGKPSKSDFTDEYLVSNNFSIYVDDDGDTICKCGKYSATIYSKTKLSFSVGGYYTK